MGCVGHVYPDSTNLLSKPEFWIADTGASVHMTAHAIGMTNTKQDSQSITMFNSDVCQTSMTGDIPGTWCDRFGQEKGRVTMTDVVVGKKGFNLFSRTKMQKAGWILGGDKLSIWLTKDGKTLKFDIPISTRKGVVFAICIKRDSNAVNEGSDTKSPELAMMAATKTMPYEMAHDKLGHIGEAATRATAKAMGWKLTGKANVCEHCAVSKAKQKAVPQVTFADPLQVGERRIYLDMSLVKPASDKVVIGKPNWLMIVDGKTQFKISRFYAAKSGMVEPTCALLKQWEGEEKKVTHIRMDNGGENMTLQARCKSSDWKLQNIKFEMTARDTPQQNSIVEIGFATIANRAKAMVSRANIPAEDRHKVYIRSCIQATRLDGLVMMRIGGVTAMRYVHQYGKLPDFLKNLHTWGEAGVVKLKSKTSPKIINRGVTCMFVGYPANHASDCVEMWDASKNSYHVTRDVTWLHRMFYSKNGEAKEAITEIQDGKGDDNGLDIPVNEDDSVKANPFEAIVAEEQEAVLDTEEQLDAYLGPEEAPNEEALNEDVQDQEPYEGLVPVTRTGRKVKKPSRLIESMNAVLPDNAGISNPERNYYEALLEMASMAKEAQEDLGNEMANVGAALGGGFENTRELRPMKCKEAMAGPDKAS